MGSVLLGVEVASALSDAIVHFAQMQQMVSRMIQDANANNNGKLTDAQVKQLEDMRHSAVNALDKAVAAQK